MLLFVASAAVGICLHYRGNVEFEREIGKYVRANPKEVTRLWRYVVIT
jgi:hypothetical protein